MGAWATRGGGVEPPREKFEYSMHRCGYEEKDAEAA